MEGSKIRIIHVYPDDKFFESASDFFDSLEGVENLYPLIDTQKKEFNYIKNISKIKFCKEEEYYKLFSTPDKEIVFLHSLCNKEIFKFLHPNKIVIWWSWGYDIYYKEERFCPPLIKVQLLKSCTKKFINSEESSSLKKEMLDFLKVPLVLYRSLKKLQARNDLIRRIDYYIPVIPLEYELLKKRSCFKAKLFVGGGPIKKRNYNLVVHNTAGNILIGNSFSRSNNHIDIFKKFKTIELGNRKLIIPISYCKEYNCSTEYFKQQLKQPANNVQWLESFLNIDEYKKINSSISHAVFGHMRQQAMGNISLGFMNGVKMYFYKDSINYQQLINQGYKVFTIDDDLTEYTLNEPLSKEEAEYNFNLMLKIRENRKEKYEQRFQEIIHEKF